jgi:hypothetical protein
MHPLLSDLVVEHHIRDLAAAAAAARSVAPAEPGSRWPRRGRAGGRRQLRTRIGFSLVEAGLHLLAAGR